MLLWQRTECGWLGPCGETVRWRAGAGCSTEIGHVTALDMEGQSARGRATNNGTAGRTHALVRQQFYNLSESCFYFYSKACLKIIVRILLNRGRIINLIYSFILYRFYTCIFEKKSQIALYVSCVHLCAPTANFLPPLYLRFSPFFSLDMSKTVFSILLNTQHWGFFSSISIINSAIFSRRKWVTLFIYIQ